MRKIYHVLAIDDDEDDQFLLQTAFQSDRDSYRFQFVTNGTDVLESIIKPDFLPDLIFLDLNMPFISGFEILKHIKNSPIYRHIPIIILSTSDADSDINRCYEMGANTYVVKPNTHQQWMDLANLVRSYWFSLARIPTQRTNK